MSWHGFKKAVNRATTTVMMQAGSIDKTVDRDFAEEERKFRIMENRTENLYREAKGYLDSVRGMNMAQSRLAQILHEFYESDTAMGHAATQYSFAVASIEEEAKVQLDNDLRITVMDPLGRLVAVLPDYNDAIKRRQKKLLDYDRLRSSARKLTERPSDDPNKLPKAEQEANYAKELYDNVNNQLMEEIPKLVDMRIAYLDPCFESLVKSQVRFNESASKRLAGISNAFPHDTMNASSAQSNVEDVLAQMRELTICGAH